MASEMWTQSSPGLLRSADASRICSLAGIATAQVNQELMRIRSFKGATFESNRRAQSARSAGYASGGKYESGGRRPKKGSQRPVRSANVQRIERIDRPDVVKLLQRSNLLPAIFFIFSRAGCDAAVQQVRRSGVRLTSTEERDEIRAIVEHSFTEVEALRRVFGSP